MLSYFKFLILYKIILIFWLCNGCMVFIKLIDLGLFDWWLLVINNNIWGIRFCCFLGNKLLVVVFSVLFMWVWLWKYGILFIVVVKEKRLIFLSVLNLMDMMGILLKIIRFNWMFGGLMVSLLVSFLMKFFCFW